MRFFPLLVVVLLCNSGLGQNNLDSLKAVVNNEDANLDDRLRSVHGLIWGGLYQQNLDSALKYSYLELELAKISEKPKAISFAHYSVGSAYFYRRNMDSTVYHYDICKKIRVETKDEQGIRIINKALARVLTFQGNFDKALEIYFESLNQEVSGTIHENHSNAHQGISSIYLNQSKYEKALEHNNIAIDICTGLNDSSSLAYALANRAEIYRLTGDKTTALKYNKQALVIFQKFGQLQNVARCYNNIGTICMDLGNDSEATEYFQKSYEMKKAGGDIQGSISSLSNLAMLHVRSHEYEKAIDKFDIALGNVKMIGDRWYESVCLINLAKTYQMMGEYDKAKDLFRKTYALADSIKNLRSMELCWMNLGTLFNGQGIVDSALSYFEKAFELSMQVKDQKDIRDLYRFRYNAYSYLGMKDSAIIAAIKLNDQLIENLATNIYTLSESEKGKYLNLVGKDVHSIFESADRYNTLSDTLRINAYNYALRSKGFMLNSSTLLRSTILNSNDSLLVELYHDWIATKRQIARNYAVGNPTKELDKKAIELENQLIGKSQLLQKFKSVHKLNWKGVQETLERNEVAIEFVRFTKQEGFHNDSDVVKLYGALIIEENSNAPKYVRLFKEAELEEIIGTFPGNNLSYIEQVYGSKENTKSQLYDLIWKPMEEELKGAKKVYVSPVGLLHKISFAALAKEQDVYLCDNYEIEMMSSTGKLALSENPNFQIPNSNQTTTLFGGIDYNSDSTTTEHWQYLDGSMSETQQIEKILKKGKVNYNYYNQSTATEAQFKEIASNSNILHIATHGFFYPDPDLALEDFVDQEESEEPINFRGGRTGVGVSTFVKSRNPLMRSGLAFAGANDVWNRTNIEGEDGVLTAAEVATIDMRNTDLVVLSACETGLGDIKGSEGVYGLQRSFKMAGVKYLIMSLWQVPDKETAEFMTSFYKNLTKTNDIKKSFNLTQKEMRNKYDPYFWAAFVLVE